MIYVIHGPDRLLAREATDAIAAEVDPEGANTSWINGRETTLEQLISAVGTAAFFGAPRVVVVSDFFGRTKGSNTDADEPASATEGKPSQPSQSPGPLLTAVPEENCLIFFEPTLAAAPAAIKSIAPKVTVIAGEPPRGAALVSWIEDAAKGAESRIDRRSAQLLAETLFPQTWDRKPANPRFDRPPDLALLTHEIEKLALAAHPNPIGAEHVAEHVAAGPDQRVFRFLDAAIGGDVRSAMNEYERLAAAGEEPAMLLAQLLGQVELTTVASFAAGRDAGTVARELGTITPARMSAVVSSSRRQAMSPGAAVASGVATDRKLKTGRIRQPVDALHDLVLALASSSNPAARNAGHSR